MLEGTAALKTQMLRGLVVSAVVAVVASRAAWAMDPVSIDVDTPAGPVQIAVTSWSGDPTAGTASGTGTLTLPFAGNAHILNATWSDVAFDVPTHKVTAGTLSLVFAPEPVTVSVGLDVTIAGLSLDAATGKWTVIGGQVAPPNPDGAIGLILSSLVDLAGAKAGTSSEGLVSLEHTLSAPLSVLGVHVGPGASLAIDFSETAAVASIPDADLSNPASLPAPGVPWRGIHLKDAKVSFGDLPAPGPNDPVATIDFLSVGWLGSTSGPPDFKGRITTTSAAPLAGKVHGLEARLKPGTSPNSGVLTFDSTAAEVVSGTFDGVVTLPGGTATADVSGLVVAYGRADGFQFLVDTATVTPPLDLGLASFAARVSSFGIDASATQKLSSTPGSTKPEAWTGLVVYQGGLAFPVPGADGNGVLSLALTDVVIPFGTGGQNPTQFDGWLALEAPAPVISVGDLKLAPLPNPPSGSTVASPEAPPGPDKTYFHFVDGALASGCLYGLLTVPGATAPAEFGATAVGSPAGLVSLECTVHDALSVLNVHVGAGASLAIDFSDAAAVASIPDARLGNPAGVPTPGVPWRGVYLAGAKVSFGDVPAPGPSDPVATIEFLSVGWMGAASGLPDFKGRITTTSAAPLAGRVFGLEARLKPGTSPNSGVLTFDSTAAEMVQGTFDGVVMLPGGTATADVSGLVVSYGRADGFQFLVDTATVTPPLDLGLGAFAAHVSSFGIDASATKKLSSTPGSTKPEAWTGLVVYQGDLSFPVPGTHDGSVLALAVTDVVVPFAQPDEFDGWLRLAGGVSSTVAKIGDLEIRVTDTPQPPLAPVAAPAFDPAVPASAAGHTYFHFEGGELVSGCLYGLLKIPGVSTDVGFGATVDAQGDLLADLAVAEIKLGQGDREIVFENVAATLDLSQSSSPAAAPTPQWTGLVLRTMEATLPWPFKTPTVITATDLLWDRGLTGTIALAPAVAATVLVASDPDSPPAKDRFQAHLTSFSMRFESGGVAAVTAAGTMEAKPFLDAVAFTVGYDAATGFVLTATSDSGVHVFGGSGSASSLLNLTFTLLAIEIPTKTASQAGALPTLRMDGSVAVNALGVSGQSFEFEDIRLRSDGTIGGGGAWIDLRDHAHWEFQKFAVDVREVGCGSMPAADGTNQVWLGLSGGLALSDMWGMSVDVQADKFRWFQDHGFAVEEIAVKATVKKTVAIEGKVKYVEDATRREFRGRIDAKISVASGIFQAGIQFVSGHEATFDYWGVSGTFLMPAAGVPLGSTGVSLYGVNGGVSRHLTPNGVDMYDWTPDAASGFAFQAGVTVGTTSDQGTTFHAGVTLTVLFEPLIIRIDGTGFVLTAMSDVANMDRVVKAYLVYDSTVPMFEAKLELGLSDAQPFKFPHLAEVRGVAVMHIDGNGAYLHVGTQASPVTARLFPDIGGGITATSWFMVDYSKVSSPTLSVSVGAYVAWSFTKEFKICDVTGEVAAGGQATVTFGPFGFNGSLSASIGAHACGFGFVLSADCGASYPPIHIQAACTLSIDLAVKTVNLSMNMEQP